MSKYWTIAVVLIGLAFVVLLCISIHQLDTKIGKLVTKDELDIVAEDCRQKLSALENRGLQIKETAQFSICSLGTKGKENKPNDSVRRYMVPGDKEPRTFDLSDGPFPNAIGAFVVPLLRVGKNNPALIDYKAQVNEKGVVTVTATAHIGETDEQCHETFFRVYVVERRK